MPRVVVAHAIGGPEVLRIEERPTGEPGPGQVRIRHTAMGVNFADLYLLRGVGVKPELPGLAGREAAAVVEAVGPGVTTLRKGQRVCYLSVIGAFADERLIAADKLFTLPDGIEDRIAAATLLKGMAAEYLVNATYPVKAGDVVLSHAAAGGLGGLIAQWSKHKGATVIGTVGANDKMAKARAYGCDHVVNYRTEDFAARVKALTGGKGATVIYDGIGKDVYEGNLDACAVRGYFVNYGHASGLPGPIDVMRINAKSMYFNKSNMFCYATTRDIGQRMADHAFDMVMKGVLRPDITRVYKLADVAQALADMECRKTTGSLVVVP